MVTFDWSLNLGHVLTMVGGIAAVGAIFYKHSLREEGFFNGLEQVKISLRESTDRLGVQMDKLTVQIEAQTTAHSMVNVSLASYDQRVLTAEMEIKELRTRNHDFANKVMNLEGRVLVFEALFRDVKKTNT